MSTQLERQYPWFEDRSAWREILTRETSSVDPAGVGHGCWTLGNGMVFAARDNVPFTRLAYLLGPTYHRDAHFSGWGAQVLHLQRDGALVAWDHQEAFRVRRTAILGAELQAGPLRLLVMDAAPPEWPIILRTVSLQNTGDRPVTGLQLEVLHEGLPDGRISERPDGWEIIQPDRRLRVVVLDEIVEMEDVAIRVQIPDLIPGEEAFFRIALITGTGEEDLDLLQDKLAMNPDGVPLATHRWWLEWMSDTVTIATDDVRLSDLVDEATLLLATQMSPAGVIAPLTERAHVTPDDELAPMRWLLRCGKLETVRSALEARFQESCRTHHLARWLPVDVTLDEIPPREPEWEQLDPPPAWSAAAIVQAHWAYWRESGDRTFIRRHFHYLRWLIEGQDITSEGLVPFGGDEPFYAAFQHTLPMEMQEQLLPNPGPYAMMRPYPWGAAPAMALSAAAGTLAVLAAILHEEESERRLNALAAQIHDTTERVFWLRDEGYYAAARSRVDGQFFRAPHLPTALAALTTGYASFDDPHARAGLDETLQYLLDTMGLPRVAPEVAPFPGYLLGALLSSLARLDDTRRDKLYLAALSCASPSGDFHARYLPVEMPAGPDGRAHPAVVAESLLGIIDFVLASDVTADTLVLAPHLPPKVQRLRLENLHLEGHAIEVISTSQGDALDVQIGNSDGQPLRAQMREDGTHTAAYLVPPSSRHHWIIPMPAANVSSLPAPREYAPRTMHFTEAPLLVLTVDADSFSDWRDEFDAVILDASMPLSPATLANALVRQDTRRYDALYLDVPETGAAWTGLSEAFWSDVGLQQALARFRDLGGVIASTLFIDSWEIQLAGQDPYGLASKHGWITLPHVPGTVSAISQVPWESAEEEDAELLLYATDGADLEVWLNGKRLWRRGGSPEHQRVRLDAILHPGDNEFAIRAERRPGRGFGFSLGIRGALRWNRDGVE